jgi:hypothetical protein
LTLGIVAAFVSANEEDQSEESCFMPLVVEQLLDVGEWKISKLACEGSRRRNADAEELVAFAVLTGACLEEALKEQGVFGIPGVAESLSNGGEGGCHGWRLLGGGLVGL